jgi:hypothetical protein
MMQKLARYWVTDYDWRKVEAKLNSYPNFSLRSTARHSFHAHSFKA